MFIAFVAIVCCDFVISQMFLEASLQVVSLLQNYPNECNHSLIMYGIKCLFFLLFGLSLHSKKVFKYMITASDDETMVCGAVLRCSMKRSEV